MSTSKLVNLRQDLKHATRAQHQRLDGYLGNKAEFQTRQQYLLFLWALIDTHKKFGLPAARQRGISDDLKLEYQRIVALEQDLGLPLAYNNSHPLEPLWKSQTNDCMSYAWGVGYVLNGSTLGASMMLKYNFLAPKWPRAYLTLGRDYAQSGQLKRFFNSLARQELNLEAAISGARETFLHLETILLPTVKPSAKDIEYADFT